MNMYLIAPGCACVIQLVALASGLAIAVLPGVRPL